MTGRTWVNLNWERAADGALSAYLSIARPGQAAERIPLPLPAVAQLLADGAMLWAVVEPARQGSLQKAQGTPEHHDHFEDMLDMVARNESLGDITTPPPPLIKGTDKDRFSGAGKVMDDTPHFIGAWGE